jgi:hypothetical protein
LFATLLLGFICTPTGFAQVLFSSIVGNVTDATGAGVPGASVRITETSTNELRTVLTNEGGFYTITTVTAGTYQMEISKVGFRGFVASHILLNQNNVVRVDARLEVGVQTERVEVNSDAAALETDRADVHAEIGTQALENLPQATRAYEGLVQLVPGAALAAGQLQGGTNNPSKGLHLRLTAPPPAASRSALRASALRISGNSTKLHSSLPSKRFKTSTSPPTRRMPSRDWQAALPST